MSTSQNKVLSFFALFFILMAIISLIAIQKLEYSASRALASRTAEVLASAINQARVSYSVNAAAKMRAHPDIQVQADYHNHALAIPNPATFAIELGQSISRPEEGFILSTYSKYPFEGRKNSAGPQDDFQQDALEKLSRVVKIFERVDTLNGLPVLRHAEAIYMKESCVGCHNNHISSPKTDWKVGDVRGALDITIPLTANTDDVAMTVGYAYVMFISFSVIGLFCIFFTLKRSNNLTKELELKVNERTALLNELAHTDALTKIANRRYFDEVSKKMINDADAKLPIALIFYDLDDFKAVNDCYGHDIGDECLAAVVDAVSTALRQKSDFHARIGGDEFAIILQNVSTDELEKIIVRILDNIRLIKIPNETSLTLTSSIGSSFVTQFVEGITINQVLKVADQALYQAKNQGRNQWVNKDFSTNFSD
ncbi:diguanylate cyclase [Colwellia psychrerythraea]|uniref:diguanylate cyclase n=1 Tax=Colwellia psychrerythraea TaxID=28229 RepID=A0A1Y5EJL4_COLPS|nr:diguanylate cyclase [Colwellia psychrerythraea]